MDGAAAPQHARAHVRRRHGHAGQLRRRGPRPIGTFSYEIILTATDSSGLKKSTSVNLPSVSDTSPPTAPAGVDGDRGRRSQIDLDWTASTDNVGVTGYRVERCQGAGCTNFAEIAAPTATSYSDTGLAPSTTYRYRVRGDRCLRQPQRLLPVAPRPPPTAPPPPPGLVGA